MRIAVRVLGWLVAVLVGLPLLVVTAALVLLNTPPGRTLAERLVGQLTGNQVAIAGLSGRFPDALRLAHAELHDRDGTWLTLDGVALDWSPLALLHKEARIDRLTAAHIGLPRLPVSDAKPATPAAESQPFSLPVRVSVDALHVARAEIGAPVAGVAAALALDGSAHLASLQDGDADVAIDRLDGPGAYTVKGRITPATLDATLRVTEPARGLVASIAKLPDIGAITLSAAVSGPRTAEATTLNLTAGPLVADAKGTVDIAGGAAELDVTAHAPAMTPAPGVSWQSVALDAHLHGPFTKPDAAGTLRLAGLQAGGAAVALLAADIQGNGGGAQLTATATGLRIPGPKPELFAAAPVQLSAAVRLDDPARPATFSLAHPLLNATGTARTAAPITVHADLTAPDLQPLAAAGGVDLQGHTALAVDLALDAATAVKLSGTLAVTGGLAPVPALVGPDARLAAEVSLAGGDVTLKQLSLDGKTLTLSAHGTDTKDTLDLAYSVALSELDVLAPSLKGAVTVSGTAKGPVNDLAADATLDGTLGAPGVPPGPVRLAVHATGLPGHPAGTVAATGTLEGAPLALDVRAERGGDGVLHATIDKADWKSLHAEGALTLPPGQTLPLGQVKLRLARLDDLRPFIGQPVSGSLDATALLDPAGVKLDARAEHAGIPGSSVARAVLAARVSDPLGQRVVAATLDADGIEAGGVGGNAKVAVNGPEAALAIRLNAALRNLAGADATLAGTATLDVPGKVLRLASFTADWKNQVVRLLSPARIGFGDGVAVDRLRVGLQQAVLDVAGQVSPRLNLTASLRGVTPDLAKPFAPSVDADGQITADAKLGGTPAAPTGTVRLNAAGLRMRTGPGRSLPPANLVASAQLAGKSAVLDARLAVGRSAVGVTGRAPLGAGPLALKVQGALDLAVLDPILSPDGRRVRGQLALDASVAGTLASPAVNGAATLTGGEVQDYGQGVRITGLEGTVRAMGDTVRLVSLTGRAGPGTVSATGSVGLTGAMPVDLALTLRNARPLASDRLTADLDANLAVRGALSGPLAVSGNVDILRATVNIPEHLPASVAVLKVRVAGAPPPPAPKPAAVVRLDLQLNTKGQIFVRGRGLDAVMGGNLHVAGTTAQPQVSGGFAMQRGTFSLAGTTLTFTRGKVGFDGAGVTNKIDPSLDFEADVVTSTTTAMLIVGGYASAPRITLSASPPLPQDEVLAQLLFGRSAKELGPFQYAQIAAALADLSGTTSGLSNPLDRVRKGLGLDRLSVGSGTQSGSGSTSAATIEAGKYVANGVYVGAKQGTTGSQTQAVVQIDITKGLKVETDVGTGAGGNSVGLTYQFEY